MNEQDQASLLARWLEEPTTTSSPDAEVLETIFVLRPDLAPAHETTVDEILDEVLTGPLATAVEPDAVEALVRWMEGRPGSAPPDGTDPEVVEAVIAMRPDLAPPHRIDLAGILDGVKEGPLARTPSEEADSVVSLHSRRTRKISSNAAFVGFGLLAAAAVALVGIRITDTPSDSGFLTDEQDDFAAISPDAPIEAEAETEQRVADSNPSTSMEQSSPESVEPPQAQPQPIPAPPSTATPAESSDWGMTDSQEATPSSRVGVTDSRPAPTSGVGFSSETTQNQGGRRSDTPDDRIEMEPDSFEMEPSSSAGSISSGTEGLARNSRTASTSDSERSTPTEFYPAAEEMDEDYAAASEEETVPSIGSGSAPFGSRSAGSTTTGQVVRSTYGAPSPWSDQLRGYRSDIDGCYEEELSRDPDAEGVLNIRFDIEDHEPSRIEITGMGTEMHQCVRTRMDTWRFPDTEDADDIEERYPLGGTDP